MIIIPTPKGLENYVPWRMGLCDLQKQYPDIEFRNTGIRPTDKMKFKAGQWVRLKNGEEVKIIAFDTYEHPLPIQEQDTPLHKFNNGIIETVVYESKYRTIVRAVHAIGVGVGYCFTDLEEWEWLKK